MTRLDTTDQDAGTGQLNRTRPFHSNPLQSSSQTGIALRMEKDSVVQETRHVSPDGALTFVVTHLSSGDVVLSFEGHQWHTHADLLASAMGIPEDTAVAQVVAALQSNRLIICIHKVGTAIRDVQLSLDPRDDLSWKGNDEALAFRFWDGTPHDPEGRRPRNLLRMEPWSPPIEDDA